MSDTKDIKKNVKLFPYYKMLSWDLLFYYSIIYLFLLQVKNISASQILLGDALYRLASCIFQIPSGRIISRLGKKNSVIVGNICVSIFAFGLLIISNFEQFLFIYVICSFGFTLKNACEPNILYDSLPKKKKIRGKFFSQIDGRGLSTFYYIDAVTAILSGFLYVINPYMPIVLCFIFCLIPTIISFKFEHTVKEKQDVPTLREYSEDIRQAFRHIKKSKRFKCLIIFYAVSAALFYVLISLRSSFLEEINLPEQYFGIVFCIFQILAATSTRMSDKIHNKFKNHTLAVLCLPVSISCIIIGILGHTNITTFTFIIIIALFCIQNMSKGPYNSLTSRYFNNFTNSKVRVRFHTIKNLIYDLTTVIFGLICSMILNIASASNTLIIIGCISTAAIVILLDYMRDKVGLEPEKYDKYDTKYESISK